jgi:methylated-DNA-[protein]-cysteine S-methyltransferase
MTLDHQVYAYKAPRIGWLKLTTTPNGVRSIDFVSQPGDAAADTPRDVMARLIDELDRYFAGKLRTFTVPVDMARGTEFQRSVWKALLDIPYGLTRSYGDIAVSLGLPRAARAVGAANGANPVPIVVPCHRVIKADGTIGGYGGGIAVKRFLLEREGITPRMGVEPTKTMICDVPARQDGRDDRA